MKKALRTVISIAACTSALLAASGCAEFIDFNSPSPLGDGVRGKSWGNAYFVDEPLYTAGAITTTNLVYGFDAASFGDTLLLAATFKDPVSGKYKLYGRNYVAGSGWSQPGSGFMVAAAGPSAQNIHLPTITRSPSGLFLASGISTAVQTVVTALNSSGSWQAQQSNVATGATAFFPSPVSSDLAMTPLPVSIIDGLGRGYIFMVNTNSKIYLSTWQPASGPSNFDVVVDAATSKIIAAAYDGLKTICLTYELNSTLTARCGDITQSPFSTSPVTINSSGTVYGHQIATGGQGKIMAVFYLKDFSNTYRVYSSLRGLDGKWSSLARVDSAMPSGYYSAPAHSSLQGTRPGVAYVGNGSYMAAWVGVNTTSKTSQVFYSRYTADEGWSDADAILPSAESYTTTPHHRAMHVFGNSDNNAGIAINTQIEATASTKELRYVTIARWHVDNGWLTPEIRGNGCIVTGSTGMPGCTQRPTGVILSSGETVVLFQDQDNDNSGIAANPGNSRLSAVEFK